MQDRVFGIETEYALIWHARGKDPGRPSNLEIWRRIECALERRMASLPQSHSALRAEGTRFLENGAAISYEAPGGALEHGLLELASPECRDPDSLLACEIAKDELAEELAREATLELQRAGWRGEVRLGKNNVDGQGHGFGSHENYWVDDPLGAGARVRLALLWALLWLVSAAVLLPIRMLSRAALFALSLGRIGRAVERREAELARRMDALGAPVRALLRLHSRLYERFHLRAIRRGSTAHLATRAVFAGAGSVAFGGGALIRVAQRPPFLRELARIHDGGDARPIFELRAPFFAPLDALRRQRRLHVLSGDANLCEWALWLRVASTALVLEAIEAEPEGWPELADPLEALRRVGADPELRERLELRDGSAACALEIQRLYLARVETVLALGPELAPWKRRALARWRETLDLLARDPEQLADRVDWIAKRKLVHGEIPLAADREALARCGAELVASAQSEPEAARLRALAFRVWRADLRYHELGPRGGFRRLAARGRIRRLSDPDAVGRARRDPPQDTRAAARGRAIRWAGEMGLAGSATWERVRLPGHRTLDLADPLDPKRGAQ